MFALDTERIKNPVLKSAQFIIKNNPHVQVCNDGVEPAAKQLLDLMQTQAYSPSTWREQPLHLKPPMPYDPTNIRTKECLDWIFLVSALNFSFWSELNGLPTRYGVMWKTSWEEDSEEQKHLQRLTLDVLALASGIPITDPKFYASETKCPDSLIREIFKPSDGCEESLPLLDKRIAIMRQCGKILLEQVPGQSYMGMLKELASMSNGTGNSTMVLLEEIVRMFPSFRDQAIYEGQKVVFFKRAQILIAETWAAFYPDNDTDVHPLLPDGVDILTMFADYRVPQILHHFGLMQYSEELIQTLHIGTPLEYGSPLECSIRAGGIVAVEILKNHMFKLLRKIDSRESRRIQNQLNSVLIDFFLWDLAKLVESGSVVTGNPVQLLPCHRTRSIFY
ncbi:hypothetical protein CPB86DRAFT_861798 [Serendipita vermifera]|nr:hypothetical protein CPB86DRAFT_861798 [Serendipita vermifera]